MTLQKCNETSVCNLQSLKNIKNFHFEAGWGRRERGGEAGRDGGLERLGEGKAPEPNLPARAV